MTTGSSQFLFHFNKEIHASNRYDLNPFVLGNKGANLVQMMLFGLPVPPGFILAAKSETPNKAKAILSIVDGIAELERILGLKFGQFKVSVRSGAPVSMPGMMETFLDISNIDDLTLAVGKVYSSWNSEKAKAYRKITNVNDNYGTAVIVQLMIDGTADENSGTGLVQTRNPITGEDKIIVEYLKMAKGPDIVDGKRTPNDDLPSGIGYELAHFAMKLERFYKYPQEIEFTVHCGHLWILQTRNAKLSQPAKTKVAIELLNQHIVSKKEAISILDVDYLNKLKSNNRIPEEAFPWLLAKGRTACPGIVHGVLAYTKEYAETRPDAILIRTETTTDDVPLLEHCSGIVTKIGGITSHAAAVARVLKKPCIVGVGGLLRDLKEGTAVTLDANSGRLYETHIKASSSPLDRDSIEALKLLS